MILNRFGKTLFMTLALLASLNCHWGKQPLHSYEGKGVILDIAKNKNSTLIKHGNIPNFMDAMAMEYRVKSPDMLAGLDKYDTVDFQISEVADSDFVLTKISKTGHQTEEEANQPNGEMMLLAGQRVPDFALTDQDNQTRHLSDFRGKQVVVTFIYTRCPLPEMCPALTHKFANIQKSLADQMQGKFHLLSISIDPEHDTPATLKTYGEKEGANFSDWSFLTGSEDQIRPVAANLGVRWTKDGTISHNMSTAVINADGILAKTYPGADWEVKDVTAEISSLSSGSPAAAKDEHSAHH